MSSPNVQFFFNFLTLILLIVFLNGVQLNAHQCFLNSAGNTTRAFWTEHDCSPDGNSGVCYARSNDCPNPFFPIRGCAPFELDSDIVKEIKEYYARHHSDMSDPDYEVPDKITAKNYCEMNEKVFGCKCLDCQHDLCNNWTTIWGDQTTETTSMEASSSSSSTTTIETNESSSTTTEEATSTTEQAPSTTTEEASSTTEETPSTTTEEASSKEDVVSSTEATRTEATSDAISIIGQSAPSSSLTLVTTVLLALAMMMMSGQRGR